MRSQQGGRTYSLRVDGVSLEVVDEEIACDVDANDKIKEFSIGEWQERETQALRMFDDAIDAPVGENDTECYSGTQTIERWIFHRLAGVARLPRRRESSTASCWSHRAARCEETTEMNCHCRSRKRGKMRKKL